MSHLSLSPCTGYQLQLASSSKHWCLHTEQPQAQHPPTSTYYYESIPSRSLRAASERRLVVPLQRGTKSLSRTFNVSALYSWFPPTRGQELCQSKHGKQSNCCYLFEKVTQICPSKLTSNALLDTWKKFCITPNSVWDGMKVSRWWHNLSFGWTSPLHVTWQAGSLWTSRICSWPDGKYKINIKFKLFYPFFLLS